jgi:type I restriction enzyme M protein
MESYSVLLKKFKENEFLHDEAKEILKIEKDRTVSAILSDIKKRGWLTARLHPEDSRKRLYKLRNPKEVILEIELEDKK